MSRDKGSNRVRITAGDEVESSKVKVAAQWPMPKAMELAVLAVLLRDSVNESDTEILDRAWRLYCASCEYLHRVEFERGGRA